MKWGRIPRFVLELATNETEQAKLKDEISACEKYIFKYIGQSESHKDLSHMLVHIITSAPKTPKTSTDDEMDVDEIDVSEEEALEIQRPFTIKIIKLHHSMWLTR